MFFNANGRERAYLDRLDAGARYSSRCRSLVMLAVAKQKRTPISMSATLSPHLRIKRNVEAKRKATTKRRPPLVPTPALVDALLDLVNRLPVQFRHPYWARREEDKLEGSDYPVNEAMILNPEGWRVDNPIAMWERLRNVLAELPLALRAFVLRDELGTIGSINSDLQCRANFEVIGKTEEKQSDIVDAAVNRIEEAFIEERQALTLSEKVGRSARRKTEQSHYVAAKQLVLRVRQRLIFVLAANELLSCLTQPETWYQLLLRRLSRLHEATQADLYIVPEGKDKGKLAVSPPVLYECLLGVEAARIRECPICFRFFWAGRKDKIGCSTNCSNAKIEEHQFEAMRKVAEYSARKAAHSRNRLKWENPPTNFTTVLFHGSSRCFW